MQCNVSAMHSHSISSSWSECSKNLMQSQLSVLIFFLTLKASIKGDLSLLALLSSGKWFWNRIFVPKKNFPNQKENMLFPSDFTTVLVVRLAAGVVCLIFLLVFVWRQKHLASNKLPQVRGCSQNATNRPFQSIYTNEREKRECHMLPCTLKKGTKIINTTFQVEWLYFYHIFWAAPISPRSTYPLGNCVDGVQKNFDHFHIS